MIKSDQLADLLEKGQQSIEGDPFIITPTPNIQKLRESGSASIDLRLGTWLVSLKRTRMSSLKVSDPTPQLQLTRSHYIPFGQEFFLHPGNFVLGITLEWLSFPAYFGAYVVGKSSWGRRGLIIATAAGVHPGFKGCITLELSNVGEIPIAIKPGMSLCQLFFHRVELTEETHRKAFDKSRYVGSRKPILGDIKPDEIASKLFEAK